MTDPRDQAIEVVARALRPDAFWNESAEYPTTDREDYQAGIDVARMDAEPVVDALIAASLLTRNPDNDVLENLFNAAKGSWYAADCRADLDAAMQRLSDEDGNFSAPASSCQPLNLDTDSAQDVSAYGDHDLARAWDEAIAEARTVVLRGRGPYETDIDLLTIENPYLTEGANHV